MASGLPQREGSQHVPKPGEQDEALCIASPQLPPCGWHAFNTWGFREVQTSHWHAASGSTIEIRLLCWVSSGWFHPHLGSCMVADARHLWGRISLQRQSRLLVLLITAAALLPRCASFRSGAAAPPASHQQLWCSPRAAPCEQCCSRLLGRSILRPSVCRSGESTRRSSRMRSSGRGHARTPPPPATCAWHWTTWRSAF